jgi:hypothetical protein
MYVFKAATTFHLPPLLDKTCTYKRHQTVAGLNTF